MTEKSSKLTKDTAIIPQNKIPISKKPQDSETSNKKLEKPIMLIADSEVPFTNNKSLTSKSPSNQPISKKSTKKNNTTDPSATQLSKKSIQTSRLENENTISTLDPQLTTGLKTPETTIESRLNHTVDIINRDEIHPLSPNTRKSRKYKSQSKIRDSSKSRDSMNSSRSHSESRNKLKNDQATWKNPNFEFSIHLPTIPQEVKEYSPPKKNGITPWDKKNRKEFKRLRFKNKSKSRRFHAEALLACNLDAIYAPRQNPRPLSKDLIKLLTPEKFERKRNRSSSANLKDTQYKESYAGLAEAYIRNSAMTLEERKTSGLNHSMMASPANSNLNTKDIEQFIRMTRERYRSAPYDDDNTAKPDPKRFLRRGKIGKTPHLIKKTTEYKTPEREVNSDDNQEEILSPKIGGGDMSPIKHSPLNTSCNSPIITDKEPEYKHRHFSQDYRKVQHIPTQFLLQQEENKKKEKEMKLRVGNRQNHHHRRIKETPKPQIINPRSDDIYYQASNKTRSLKAELKVSDGPSVKFGTSPRMELFRDQADIAGIYNPVVISSLSNRSARIVAPTFLKSRQFNDIKPAPGQYNIIRDFDVPPGHYGFAAKILLDEKNKTSEMFGSKLMSYSNVKGNSKLGCFPEASKGDIYNLREAQELPGPGAYDIYMYPKTKGCSFTMSKRIDLLELPTIEETNKFYVA